MLTIPGKQSCMKHGLTVSFQSLCDCGLEAEGEGVVPAHRDLACLIARRLICEQLLAPTSGHTTGEER